MSHWTDKKVLISEVQNVLHIRQNKSTLFRSWSLIIRQASKMYPDVNDESLFTILFSLHLG